MAVTCRENTALQDDVIVLYAMRTLFVFMRKGLFSVEDIKADMWDLFSKELI